MKLINKTQRIYLGLVGVLLVVWSGIFLYAISSAIRDNIDETLQSELQALVQRAKSEESLPTIATQQIQIHKVPRVLTDAITLKDTTLYNSIEQESFPYRQATTQINIAGSAYKLTLRRSMVEYDDLFETILIMEIVFVVFLVVGLIFINRTVLQRLWSPFYNTLQKITGYGLEGGSIEWEETEIDEFKRLNTVLEEMTRRIENEYRQLKQFTENASHEIQTPLSVIQNQIEMLIQEESFPENQWNRLQKISAMAGKLSRLNRALLLLTKIENEQFADRQQININDLLHSLTEEYRHLAEVRDLTMHVDLEPEVTLRMNPDLAEMLFRNLLSNAIKHSQAEGTIRIELNKNRFIIANTGAEPSQDPSTLFGRFRKEEEYSDSLGLGLSIVQSIAEAHDFNLIYRFDQHKEMHIIEIEF